MSRSQKPAFYPLSPLQQGMLFHALEAPASDAYFEQSPLWLDGELDLRALHRAWQVVVDRHEVLRTSFVWGKVREPVQVVQPRLRLPMAVMDLSGVANVEPEVRGDGPVAELLRQDRLHPFDLGRAPLLRLTVLRLHAHSWVMVWSCHHILLDGWSQALITADLFRAYTILQGARDASAAAAGQQVESVLGPAPPPFRGYIAWLRKRPREETEAYWRQRLAGYDESVALASLLPKSPLPKSPQPKIPPTTDEDVVGGTTVRLQTALSAELVARLQGYVRSHGLTLNTLFQGALALLLARYSARSDVAFGIVVAGRPPQLPGAERMVGLFINTVPLRVSTAGVAPGDGGQPSTAALDWLRELHTEAGRQRAFEHAPLLDVQRWSDVPPGGQLFDTLLAFENYPVEQPTGSEALRLRWLPSPSGTNFPLSLVVVPGEQMWLNAHYAGASLDATAVHRLVRHLRTLVDGLGRDGARLEALPLLSTAERHQLCVEWTDAASPFAAAASLAELAALRVRARPESVAVVYGRRHLSYRELARRSGTVAAQLQLHGIRRGDIVGLYLERSPELIVALLAILRAGGAYLPLDLAYPDERVAFLLADAGATSVVTDGAHAEKLPAPWGGQRLCLENLLAPVALPAAQRVTEDELHGDDLAYVIYTSGSSGRPKGTAVPQRAVVRLILGQHRPSQAYGQLGPETRFGQVANTSFDAATYEIWGALLSGGCLVGVPRRVSLQPRHLGRFLRRRRIDTTFITAALFAQTVQVDPYAFSGMRDLLVGGEAVDPDAARRLLTGPAPPRRLLNGYGPTECTTFAVVGQIEPPPVGAKSVPLGRPIGNTDVRVLDRAGEPVPVGVAGELRLGGAGLAWGYLGRAALTAERFVPAGEWLAGGLVGRGRRLYRTGDLVRWLGDGRLDFLGRLDDQVKLRGYRIEPGEIAARLREHESVRDAVVRLLPSGEGERRLVAWVIPAPGAHGGVPPHPAWRAYLAQRLPDYMVPSLFVPVEAIPLTAHGKADHRALATLAETSAIGPLDAYVPPRTATEELLAGLYAQVLEAPEGTRVGAEGHFFDLGGHSLLAMRLVARIAEVLEVELPLGELFEHPRVSELAGRLDQLAFGAADWRSTPIELLERAAGAEMLLEAPLSFAQQRLWFLDRLEPGNAFYNIATALELRPTAETGGTLSLRAFVAAVDELAHRHEILRTTYTTVSGQPRQRVHAWESRPRRCSSRSVDLSKLIDLRALDCATAEEQQQRLLQRESRRPFDLAHGPVVRALLLCRDDRHTLLLTLHHIAGDGWSMGVLVRDFSACYRALLEQNGTQDREQDSESLAGQKDGPRPLPLQPLPLQYADYAHWQRQRLDTEQLTAGVDWWRQQLEGLPSHLDLPTDRPRPAVQSYRGAALPLRLDDLSEPLHELARQQGVTLFMVLLAAYQLLLGKLAASRDLAVGTPVAGRDRSEFERLVGCFVNTVVLRARLAGEGAAPPANVAQLLRNTRQTCLDAFAHQEVPFEKLVETLAPERDLARAALFQAMFVLNSTPRPRLRLPGLEASALSVGTDSSKFDLTLTLAAAETSTDAAPAESPRREGQLGGQLAYSRDLFDATTIEHLGRRLRALLGAWVEDPECELDALPWMAPVEIHQLRHEWGGAGLPALRGAVPSVVERLRQQAQRAPLAAALEQDGVVLTYGELQQRAERLAGHLAHALRTTAVDARFDATESVVALALERTPAYVVAAYAALLAGAAYLPLDTAQPAVRLRRLLADVARSAPGAERPLVLVTSADGERNTSDPFTVVAVDAQGEPVAADDESATTSPPPVWATEPDAQRLAYLITTSGSTGKPKPVAVPHAALRKLLVWAPEAYEVRAGDRSALFGGLGFDATVLDLWLPLVSGACLCLPPAGDRGRELFAAPTVLRTWIAEARLTHAKLPTPLLERLLELPPPAAASDTEGSALRVLITGGDRLHVGLPVAWADLGIRLYNQYGPSETTVLVSRARVLSDAGRGSSGLPSLGRPAAGACLSVVDAQFDLVPSGCAGELLICGPGLARGYLDRPARTAVSFVPDLWGRGARAYRSGDLVRWLADGELEFLGRLDRQVKLRGFRIEPGEIEAALLARDEVAHVAVVLRGEGREARLVAFVVVGEKMSGHPDPSLPTALQAYLRHELPPYMVPASIVVLDVLPTTERGKLDRRALATWSLDVPASPPEAPSDISAPGDTAAPREATGLRRTIADIWRRVLDVEQVAAGDNFFDLGGHSLLLVEVQEALQLELDREVRVLDLFRYPTVEALAGYLGEGQREQLLPAVTPRARDSRAPDVPTGAVAVIGMAGRFPGAPDLDAFWHNLQGGVEGITFFDRDELLAAGVPPAQADDPNYVPAMGVLEDADQFDARFFGYAPRDAQLLDPQIRVCLELAWHAMEDAGYDPRRYPGRVGVYAGASQSGYQLNVYSQPELLARLGGLQVEPTNVQRLPLVVSYQLDLKGPSFYLYTACSTSLLAVHLARQALLDGDCDMALAGGVAIDAVPRGYRFEPGGILSSDGHTRSFSDQASGAVKGNGAGLVVLKRLDRALADGDRIQAVIRGTAVNNDGASKVGFTAPSVAGEASAVRDALAAAGVPASSVQLIEAHGSATPLGDPIEVEALQLAFQADGAEAETPVAIGSVKSNIGHLDTAAGVAGLLKAILALRHQQQPPSIGCQRPNPAIDFGAGPFFVNTELRPWPVPETAAGPAPRRAGVSSFGIGGTNVHVVVEEAPPLAARDASPPWHLWLLSAKTEAAVAARCQDLANFLPHCQPAPDPADVAFTLHAGRGVFAHRRALVVRDLADAVEVLQGATEGSPQAARLLLGQVDERAEAAAREPVFLLGGLGDQYPGMARGLYQHEPVFRRELERCAAVLDRVLDVPLTELLFPEAFGGVEAGEGEAASAGPDLRALLGRGKDRGHDGESEAQRAARRVARLRLDRTRYLQPALFAVDYALARLLEARGVQPAALLGYSLGEYVAACLAGVFDLDEALVLVAERARWIDDLPPGAMLAVSLPETAVETRLAAGDGVYLAAVNAPEVCVVAGDVEAVEAFQAALDADGIAARRLATTHAFHTPHMAGAAEGLRAALARVELRPPCRPVLSNVTGTWLRAEEATDPEYWLRHLRSPVRFAPAVGELATPGRVLVEVGPGQGLSTLAMQHPGTSASGSDSGESRSAVRALATLRAEADPRPDRAVLLDAFARLWLAGVDLDPGALHAGPDDPPRRRVGLPLYPFERQRYWVERDPAFFARLAGTETAATSVPSAASPAASSVGKGAGRIEDEVGEQPVPAASGDFARPALATAYVEPAPGAQQTLAGLWRDLLGVDPVGAHDNFFELGGHSLLGTQLLSRLRAEHGVELELRHLFATPTVAGLAEHLPENLLQEGARVDGMSSRASRAAAPIERQPESPSRQERREYPLSFAQQRLWFFDQLVPGNPFYNIGQAHLAEGALDLARLHAVMRRIVARHASLRTTFAAAGSATESGSRDPVQIVAPPGAVDIELPLVDWSALPSEVADARLEGLLTQALSLGFDLVRGPLLRLLVVRLPTDPETRQPRHAIFASMHHIISDGWSVSVFLREFTALYTSAAPVGPRGTPLPPLPIQYADFATWQREWLSGERLDAELEHWRAALDGAPRILELPIDRPRPSLQSFRGARHRFQMPLELRRRLETLARERSASLFMLLLSVFYLLLQRLSGADDLLVGSPVANRNRAEIEPLIGFFVNTLVLRGDLRTRGNREATFEDVVARVRDATLDAYAHQDLPFERLVEELAPQRHLSHEPIYQVLFVLQNVPVRVQQLPGLTLRALRADPDSARHDLALAVYETSTGLLGDVEYSTDLFDSTTIARIGDAYHQLLTAAVEQPSAPLSSLSMLGPAARHQLLREWNRPWTPATEPFVTGTRTGGGVLSDDPLANFRYWVAATPDRIAVAYPEEAEPGQPWRPIRLLSYAELDRRARRLATELQALGVGPEVPVGLFLQRSPEMILAIVGTLAAGGAYLPIDLAHPAERIAAMLQDAAVRVVLTDETSAPSLPEVPHVALVTLRRGQVKVPVTASRAEGPTWDRAAELPGDQLAAVIYTSGSTGTPKGVAISHRILSNMIQRYACLQVRPGDRLSQMNNIAFDAAGMEVWGALMVGATLVGVSRDVLLVPARLAELTRRETLNLLVLTTAVFNLLVDEEPRRFQSCDRLSFGGEAADPSSLRRMAARLRRIGRPMPLVNGYGPAETGSVTTAFDAQHLPAEALSVPIGRSLPGAAAYVVGRRGALLGAGIPGELWIGGQGVTRGYLRRPALTADRFRPDPFCSDFRSEPLRSSLQPPPGHRLYRTGDLVRWLPGGLLDFLGRLDDQIKVRGLRIELGEITAHLQQHAQLREAIVLAPELSVGSSAESEHRLVAWVVPKADDPPEDLPERLRDWLAERLPPYMVPSVFVPLLDLPLTPNGKVDRQSLVEHYLTPDDLAHLRRHRFEPPADDLEEQLAAIWRAVLGRADELESVGRNDDFFQLGGHSLLATRVVTRVQDELGVELGVAEVFEAPVLSALADRLRPRLAQRGEGAASRVEMPPIERRDDPAAPLPLSYAQQRLWFLQQLEPDLVAYNVQVDLLLEGRLDAGALRDTFGEILRRHEVLRTVFRQQFVDDGGAEAVRAVQLVQGWTPFTLPVVDLAALTPAESSRQSDALSRREAGRPFDLAHDRMLRAVLVRHQRHSHRLLCTVHHIASDGWSSDILVREVSQLYSARVEGRWRPSADAPPLPLLPVQYGDFTLWQRRWIEGAAATGAASTEDEGSVLDRQLAAWRQRLHGAATLELPTDHPRPAVFESLGGVVEQVWPSELSAAIEAHAQRAGATLFQVLTAAFQALLGRTTQQRDVSVGTPIAGRRRHELESLIGFFVNTLVLRADLAAAPTFDRLLRQCRRRVLEAFDHQDVPFERLVEELAPERDRSRTPLFQVMFGVHRAGTGSLSLPGLRLRLAPLAVGRARFDLECFLFEGRDADDRLRLSVSCNYRRELFDATTIRRLLCHFQALTRAALETPNVPLDHLPLLAAAEYWQLVGEWQDIVAPSAAATVPSGSVLDLVARQVEQRPAAAALVFGRQVVSYRQLWQRAGDLAANLHRRGVRRGDVVALHLRRSAEYFVTLLGVLRASAAYLPLDPSHPDERLSFLLADAGAVAMVSHDGTSAAARLRFDGTVLSATSLSALPSEIDGPRHDLTADDLVFVLYTSGSTGRPKGVAMGHGAIHNLVTWQAARVGAGRALQFAATSFDLSFLDTFSTWSAGGTLVVASENLRADPRRLLRHSVEQSVDRLFLPYAALQQLAESAERMDVLPPVRHIVSTAEALRITPAVRDFCHRLQAAGELRLGDSLYLDNDYGPTETHVASVEALGPDVDAWPVLPAIGRPLPGVQTYVLGRAQDGLGEPVPIGVAGELLVGGAALARGYLRRPALTAERFLPDPFARAGGSRLYRTGDLVRHLADGRLQYLQRVDHQLKVRGFRIEPGEIEARLSALPGVRDAVVVLREVEGDPRLVAYTLDDPAVEAKPEPSALRAGLEAQLPSYMVPQHFVHLEAWPQTATGKIDRNALPAPDASTAQAAYVAPRTDTEDAIAELWSGYLHVEKVGIHDDFFELGGHSMMATQMMAELQDMAGVEIPLNRLFEARTVETLAAVVEVLMAADERSD